MPRRVKRKPQGRPALPAKAALPGCILMLDLGSLHCGWALARVDAAGKATERQSGVLHLEAVSRLRWKRVRYFSQWVGKLITEHGVTWLAAEEPHTGYDNVGTRHLLHGMYAFADVISGLRFHQPVTPIQRTEVFTATVGWCWRPLEGAELVAWEAKLRRLKKWPPRTKRVPTRHPSKAEILAAVNARHGSKITSEDEADAVAGLDMILAELAGTGPAPQAVEQLVVKEPKRRIPSVAALPLFAKAVKARGRKREVGPT